MTEGETGREGAPTTYEETEPSTNRALRLIPCCFRYEDKPVATGCSLDTFARGILFIGSNLILGPALLALANEAAGCNPGLGPYCTKRVYGFRPSSLLANVAVFSSLVVSVCLPLFGSIVDHTRFRREVGIYTALFGVIVNGIQVMLGPTTWLAVAILQVVAFALFATHNTAAYAYATELSPMDPAMQTKYNTQFNVSSGVSIFAILVIAIIPARIYDLDDVQTARVSQVVSTVIGAIMFYIAWKFFLPPSPARRKVPEGSTLLSSGFRKLARTASSIAKDKESAHLRWLIPSIVLGEAASTSIATLSATFSVEVLRLDSVELLASYIIALFFAIPGNWIGAWVSLKLQNPIRSTMLCNFIFAVSVLSASLHMRGPQHKIANYFYAAIWGMITGWQTPIHITSFMTLVRPGSEAEMMGIFLFSVDLLAFAPPLVFSIINEAGHSIAYGLGSLAIFLILSIILSLPIQNYKRVLEKARPDISSLELTDDSRKESKTDENLVEVENENEHAF